MSSQLELTRKSSALLLQDAVHRSDSATLLGLQERAFTFAFRGLVYPQIWEDPDVDMAALDIRSTDRIVAIASGGCNGMSYLIGDPERIDLVDLNAAHIALNRLKLAAAAHLPDYETFHTFFARADQPANIVAYDRFIAPFLDPSSRAHWDARNAFGSRRIEQFSRGFYRTGLLGRFIGFAHLLARTHGVDPGRLLSSRDSRERYEIFQNEVAPLFERRLVRWLLNRRASLFGLGIPPAQYDTLAGGRPMSKVVRERLQRLACNFDHRDNYFAWQAFARRYAPEGNGPLPPYLERRNFRAIRSRVCRISVRHAALTEHLAAQADASFDCFVLLDAQDWMEDRDLTALWHQIDRTARPGARAIFRTAGEATILPGRVPPSILRHWHYQEERSRELHARDRSAIYGGFHLYVRHGRRL